MRREEWEQDMRERRPGIDFPDTAGNEGNHYRRILREHGPLATVVVILLGGPFLLFGIFGFVSSLTDIIPVISLLTGALCCALILFFGLLMLFRGLFRPPIIRRK